MLLLSLPTCGMGLPGKGGGGGGGGGVDPVANLCLCFCHFCVLHSHPCAPLPSPTVQLGRVTEGPILFTSTNPKDAGQHSAGLGGAEPHLGPVMAHPSVFPHIPRDPSRASPPLPGVNESSHRHNQLLATQQCPSSEQARGGGG